MLEKKFRAISPQLITSNGDSSGKIGVEDSTIFRVEQEVLLKADSIPNLPARVLDVLDENILVLGPKDAKVRSQTIDLSSYTLVKNTTIEAPLQLRPTVTEQDVERWSFEESPVVARRVYQVDGLGRPFGKDNPIPVQLTDGEVNIGSVNAELEVQLSHRDNYPDVGDIADSVQIGDGQDILRINPDGSISTADSGLEKRIDVEGNIVYLGVAEPGTDPSLPLWRISRTVKTAEGDEITLLAGTGTFDQVWDNRTSLFAAESEIDFFDRRFERLLPILNNANFLKLADFDRVTPVFNADSIEMNYFQNNANIAKVIVRYVTDLDWEFNLERYINNDNGDILLDDDDTPLFLD